MASREVWEILSGLTASLVCNYPALGIEVAGRAGRAIRNDYLSLAKWTDVDLDNGIWTIPAKNTLDKKDQVHHLTPKDILWFKNLKSIADKCGSKFVWPSEKKKRSSIYPLEIAKARLCFRPLETERSSLPNDEDDEDQGWESGHYYDPNNGGDNEEDEGLEDSDGDNEGDDSEGETEEQDDHKDEGYVSFAQSNDLDDIVRPLRLDPPESGGFARGNYAVREGLGKAPSRILRGQGSDHVAVYLALGGIIKTLEQASLTEYGQETEEEDLGKFYLPKKPKAGRSRTLVPYPKELMVCRGNSSALNTNEPTSIVGFLAGLHGPRLFVIELLYLGDMGAAKRLRDELLRVLPSLSTVKRWKWPKQSKRRDKMRRLTDLVNLAIGELHPIAAGCDKCCGRGILATGTFSKVSVQICQECNGRGFNYASEKRLYEALGITKSVWEDHWRNKYADILDVVGIWQQEAERHILAGSRRKRGAASCKAAHTAAPFTAARTTKLLVE